jgi:hypothetical protein
VECDDGEAMWEDLAELGELAPCGSGDIGDCSVVFGFGAQGNVDCLNFLTSPLQPSEVRLGLCGGMDHTEFMFVSSDLHL